MRSIVLIAILILGFGQVSRAQTEVRASVLSIDPLQISSASCMEQLEDHWFIAGDDAPYVHILNNAFKLTQTIQVSSLKHAEDGRLKNSEKQDLEAMVKIPWGKDEDVLIFGSGTSSKRNILIRIDYDGGEDYKVKEYDLSKFYKHLRKESGSDKDDFNIEGAATWKDQLLLLNRELNQLCVMNSAEFRQYMKDPKKGLPNIRTYQYDLPVLDGNRSGFSGACVIPALDLLVFTAVEEHKPDWVNSKEIPGSFIGVIDLNELGNKSPVFTPVTQGTAIFPGKIESIVCTAYNDNELDFQCVTDNDKGESLLLKVKLHKTE